MAANRRVVGPSSRSGLPWQTTGGQRTTYHRTQQNAEKAGRTDLRRNGGGELTTQNRQGRFRDSDTVPPGRDPHPPKDTR
jgi:hypothetical protein